jgi:hypothetical protein
MKTPITVAAMLGTLRMSVARARMSFRERAVVFPVSLAMIISATTSYTWCHEESTVVGIQRERAKL